MSVSKPVLPRRPAPGATVRSLPSCTSCPVCGTEECLFLEELGMYCGTMAAAQLASGGGRPPLAGEEGEAA